MTAMFRKPSSVGDILFHEFLAPLSLKAAELSKLLLIDERTAAALIEGQLKLTTGMAYRLAKAFDTSVDFWINIQLSVERWEKENDATFQDELNRIVSVGNYIAIK